MTNDKRLALILLTITAVSFTISYVTTVSLQASKPSKTIYSSTTSPRYTTKTPEPTEEPNTEMGYTQSPTGELLINSIYNKLILNTPNSIATPKKTPDPVIKNNDPIHTGTQPTIQVFKSNTVVINRVAYVRSGVFTHPVPDTNSIVLNILQKGQAVTIISNTGGWYLLSDGSYVWNSFIQFGEVHQDKPTKQDKPNKKKCEKSIGDLNTIISPEPTPVIIEFETTFDGKVH